MIYTHVYVYIRTYIHICRYTYIHISCRVKVTKLSWTHGTTCLHGDELHGCCMLRNLDKANSSVVTNPKPFQYTRWDPTIVISRVITPLIGVLIPATHFIRLLIGVSIPFVTIVGAHFVASAGIEQVFREVQHFHCLASEIIPDIPRSEYLEKCSKLMVLESVAKKSSFMMESYFRATRKFLFPRSFQVNRHIYQTISSCSCGYSSPNVCI